MVADAFTSKLRSLVPIQEARALVLSACNTSEPITIDVSVATGYVLAGDVSSSENVPPFANSAVDGYAVRAVDTGGAGLTQPVSLRVVGESPPEQRVMLTFLMEPRFAS